MNGICIPGGCVTAVVIVMGMFGLVGLAMWGDDLIRRKRASRK